jgi:hypothetical protein
MVIFPSESASVIRATADGESSALRGVASLQCNFLQGRPVTSTYAGHGSRSPTGLATTWQTGFSFRGSFRRCGFAVGNLGFSHPCGLMILIDRQIRSVSRVFLVSHQSNRACGTRHLALAQLFGFIGGLMSG